MVECDWRGCCDDVLCRGEGTVVLAGLSNSTYRVSNKVKIRIFEML